MTISKLTRRLGRLNKANKKRNHAISWEESRVKGSITEQVRRKHLNRFPAIAKEADKEIRSLRVRLEYLRLCRTPRRVSEGAAHAAVIQRGYMKTMAFLRFNQIRTKATSNY